MVDLFPIVAVLFGTLGWRPQSLLPSIRSTESLERVVVYHSDHEKSRSALTKVASFCEAFGVPLAPVELDNAFNLLQISRRMRDDVRKAKAAGATVRFNIAGGTRVMSSAALLVCILEGVPTTYVHDDTGEEVALPLLRMNYAEHLSARQREILKFLVDQADTPYSETALARAMHVHKTTMNHHVRLLAEKGVVEIAPDPRDARAYVVRAAPGAELLVG